MSPQLSGPERGQLREILDQAFDRRSLERALAESDPSRDFDSLVSEGDFSEQLFELIDKASRGGWLDQLAVVLAQELPERADLIGRMRTILAAVERRANEGPAATDPGFNQRRQRRFLSSRNLVIAAIVLVGVVAVVAARYLFDRRLETPDFLEEGDARVMTLANAIGRQSARLVNAGRASLRFTLAEVSDPTLYLWPEEADKEIPGRSTVNMFAALGVGAKATEYSFVVRSDAAPDLRVTVRVPDLAQLQEQQAQLVGDVAGAIEALLTGPDGARLREAGPNDPEAVSAMVAAARTSLARANPELPESAQWVLAAEALHATNWPGLAVAALREAEKASPSTAHMVGAQRLAAEAAALAGVTAVFQGSSIPAVSATEVAPSADRNLLVATAPELAMQLAGRLEQVPALKVFGLSLSGDAQMAAGDTASARRSLEAAAELRQTPSVTARLKVVSAVSPASGSPPSAAAARARVHDAGTLRTERPTARQPPGGAR